MTEVKDKSEVSAKTTKLSIAELANVPMEFKLGELTLELRQLKLQELFGHFEQKIRAKKLKEAQEMADLMDNEQNKNNFLISVWKNLPAGVELTDLVAETMQSIDGIADIIALSSGATVSEINQQIELDKVSELVPLITWIIGVGAEDFELNEEEEGAEKKTV